MTTLEELLWAAMKMREAQTDRDNLIRKATAEGKSLREIAKMAMMSHAGVAKVLAR